MNKRLALTLLAALTGAALAQAPAPAAETAPGFSARSAAARYTSSPVRLTMTIQNTGGQAQELSAPRDSRQNCTFGPLVRVLEVGTRKVVYPPAEGQGEPMLCAQDMWMETVVAGGSVKLERTLDLPAGDYMIESWFGSGAQAKIAAEPVRVTVW